MIANSMSVFSTVLCLLIGVMNYAKACFLDMKLMLTQIDRLTKGERSELMRTQCVKQAVILHDRVNRYFFHSKTLFSNFRMHFCFYCRFLREMKDLMNLVVLSTMIPWTMCICSALYLILMAMVAKTVLTILSIKDGFRFLSFPFQYTGTNFFYAAQMPFAASSVPLTLSFTYFYLGQKYYSQTMILSDAIYAMEWYRHPRSVQRLVQFMMHRSQQPFYLGAYGIMILNLENFLGVSNSIVD